MILVERLKYESYVVLFQMNNHVQRVGLETNGYQIFGRKSWASPIPGQIYSLTVVFIWNDSTHSKVVLGCNHISRLPDGRIGFPDIRRIQFASDLSQSGVTQTFCCSLFEYKDLGS